MGFEIFMGFLNKIMNFNFLNRHRAIISFILDALWSLVFLKTVIHLISFVTYEGGKRVCCSQYHFIIIWMSPGNTVISSMSFLMLETCSLSCSNSRFHSHYGFDNFLIFSEDSLFHWFSLFLFFILFIYLYNYLFPLACFSFSFFTFPKS